MFDMTIDPTLPKQEAYRELAQAARQLVAGERDAIANMANVAALLWHSLPDINWVGFYRLVEGELVLGPFQGKPACIRISLGKGVCGTAASTLSVQRVDDVHSFPGHIACDAASRSEIVLPVIVASRLVGVLDIDSPLPARFDAQDELGLTSLLHEISAALDDGN